MLGQEIDLLVNYPRTKRDVKARGAEKTPEDRAIARQFGKDFFDGDRRHGYGGFGYMARFWEPVIPTMQEHFGLTADSSVLDVGCAKGFMMYDMSRLIPGITVKGVDVSEYAVTHGKPEMIPHMQAADARALPFQDDSFDVVISINTVHNLDEAECAKALQEIERVSRGKSFITVDAYETEEEREAMFAWNLTAKTIKHVDDWKAFFEATGYTGDFYWFKP